MIKRFLNDRLIFIRILVVIVVLAALILPYLDLMSHSKTPIIIMMTVLIFHIVDDKFGENN